MTGIVNLDTLLNTMSPVLHDDEYVFCCVNGEPSDYQKLNPVATFREVEGLTLVLPKQTAINAKINFESVFRMITLTVHSSLDAVGMTAAVSTKLTNKGICANIIAAYYHDHIFVQSEQAELALEALNEFGMN